MKRKEIFNIIEKVFREVLEEENLSINESFTAHDVDGWDSLTHIILVIEIEKNLKIRFLSSEIISWENIGEMIDCIEDKFK
mgnify:FL=1